MLSTTTNSKGKSSKSFYSPENTERDEVGYENTEYDKVRGYVGSYDASSSYGAPGKDGRFRGRGRVTEFRHSRGDRRGGGRGRGGYPFRGDRDPSENTYKYQESLGHSNADTWNQTSSGKFYENSELAVNLPEDPRISKLLRRLYAEVDVDKSLVICGKLQDAVMLPENARYIRRSYDILVESLLDILYEAPGPETKESAAVVLGRIGYVMGPDYRKHLDWITSQYSHHNLSIKHLLTLSFSETFQLDAESSNLSEYAKLTMEHLQTVIENTDSPEIFIAAINAMILMSNSYPEHFANHFVDTVDILVGWHVDNSQPKKIKDFALQSLLKLSRHWQADVGFSVNLLNQFIEDMVVYSNMVQKDSNEIDIDTNVDVTSKEDCMQKLTSFFNVFNSVVKSLGVLLNPNASQTVTWSYLTETMTKVLEVIEKVLKENADEDIIISGNYCITLLMGHLQAKMSSCSSMLFEIIYIELEHYLQIGENVSLSVIGLIITTIKGIASNLPIEFITRIIGPESLLRPLRFTDNKSILLGVMSIYNNLLNLKNIPLLQETYKFVLTDIQNSYSLIIPGIQIIQIDYEDRVLKIDAEKSVIFYLQCLSELANASNSIIGMWALQPSILELLAVKMCPHNESLMIQCPTLQYSILYLLYSHCKKNNHFVASSDLVSNSQMRTSDIFGISSLSLGEVSGSSPTSGHLAVILNVLSIILEKDVPYETLLLILNWTSDIICQLEKYLSIVSVSKVFMCLVTNMLALGYSFDNDIVMLVMKNSQNLLRNKKLTWNIMILKSVATLCLLHIDNRDQSLSKICFEVLFELPWDIVQLELDKQQITVFTSRKMTLQLLNHDTKNNSFKEYLLRGSFASLSMQHFKMLMNCLLEAQHEEKDFMIDAFLTTWPLQVFESDENNLPFFRQCVLNFSSICIGWALSELALNCVILKLRTPLGKPQETFMKIEGALKAFAREISSPDSKYTGMDQYKLMDVVTRQQCRSRWITEFMMFLEKYIYNAAEGTAIVLPAVAKPVKTFFHTNWFTCREWLTRVRPAALAVSLYAGHLGAAIYHAQIILQLAASSTTNMDIEAITLSLARALIKLKEPDVLHGLYIWINKTFDKKLHWLKAAAEQADSKYESSLEHYKKLMITMPNSEVEDSSETISADSKTGHFISEQIMESYKNLQNWEDMREWIESECTSCVSQWNSFHTLELFENDVKIPDHFGNWDIIDTEAIETPKNMSSYQGLINKIESTLVCTAVNMSYENGIEKYETILNECNDLLNITFEEFTRHNSTFFLKEISVLQLATKGLRTMTQKGKSILNPFRPSSIKDHKFGTTFDNLSRIFWWNQYFSKLNMSEENAYYAECLRLDIIRSARKANNLNMASNELLKYLKHNGAFHIYLGDLNTLDELSDVFLMSTNIYELDIWTLNNVTALMEFCKLTYEHETTKSRAINLCASVSLGLSQRLAIGEQSYELREKGTRMLLTLSKWVQNENVLIETQDSPLTKLVAALPEIGLVDNNISENVIPLSDSAVGKLLQFSVNQCPGLAKAWANFAAWCFRWGRKMVEYSSKTGDQLTDSDKLQIESVMIGCSPQDFEAVCEILSKTKATCDDEDIDWNEINTSDMIESQLRTVPSLSHAFPEHLALLLDIWRQAQKRVFSYFELSADAYFKFLQLICASDYINHSGEYAVVSATLRLLRLIVKHAMELQTVLESGLANTPTQPWKVIIPQLFSRLNHPETYVRKCVSDLLCRLAEDTPHLITFPAVVGAVENEQRSITELNVARSYISNDTESGGQHFSDCDETSSEKIVNKELNSCFLDMVETLANQAPTTILQVKLLVKELQRINLLWDELWLGTLVQHHSEFSKKLTHLEAEIIKVKNNINLSTEEKSKLIKEKHRIIFESIVVVLEQLNQITSAEAETPHESSFQTRFQTLINEVIDKLKNPVNPDKPQESWAPLKQLQIKLQQKVNKRASYVLKMTDISPVLANLKNTVISMPGVHTHQRAIRVTIKSIENNVSILPTKTRPKKLVFHGSDGKSYTYLFKGLEDLHLDERIMQLLSIVNTMMARDSENNDNQTYRARHYSVIPLGPRSGLISWVDNVTPLFALYKRWQNREAAVLSAKKNKTVNVLRPSELFYNKLNPLLQEAGVAIENRKEWPLSVLKQVLAELSAETPRDLLWRELWCGSVTPEQWWQMVRRYSYSVAVMSTIGYIIGLGDRHLDNVLVDLTSGEVVHIDYNVCFEKGKTLRVPEKVPFRMTPNLVTALGVTGVEGMFRVSCEHVLRVMRRGRETLLTLLEAFVYDPLVEWGAAGAGGAAAGGRRRRSQRDARTALAMLAVRAQELRHDLADNTEQFLAVIPEIQENIENWLQEDESLQSIESRLQDCHRQMALVKEIEAYGPNLSGHPLYAISQKYTTYKQAKNAVEDSMKALVKILKDFDALTDTFAAAEEAVRGPQLMLWVREFGAADDLEPEPIFRHIEEFLTNAGQSGMLAQCERAEAELAQAARHTAGLVRATLDLLSQYAAVAQYYPRTHTEQYRVAAFREGLAAALEARSPDVCREVAARLTALGAADAPPPAPVAQHLVAYNYRLQTLSAEAAAALNEAFEAVQRDAAAGAAADDAYEEAKANASAWLRAEEGAAAALECVAVGSLCALNRRYLMLESGAQSAGDCLAELTSRDGEWFLDEMCALSTQAVEALSLLPLQAAAADEPTLPLAVECVRDANRALLHLQQLDHNFSTVILPEALKKLHAEEPTTLRLVEEMEALVAATPLPLPELVAQLDLHLRYVLMDMESPASEAQLMAAELRARYETLVAGASGPEAESGPQSEGRMLLLGFNGLFAALETVGPSPHALERLAARTPAAWRKIDQISLAMHMSAGCESEAARGVGELALWVRRVQAVADVLGQCARHAAAFRGLAPLAALPPPDYAALCKPVRRFTAEVVSRRLLGVPSRALGAVLCLLLRRARLDLGAEIEQKEIGASWSVPLEALCDKAREASACPAAQLERAGALYAAAERARRAHRRRAALCRRLEVTRAHAHCARLRLAAHSQLHADVVGNSGNVGPALARHARELTAAQERVAAAHAKAHALLTQAHQRVKWGAGANPALASVVVSLECAWAAASSRADALGVVAGQLAGHARAAAHQRARNPKLARTARQALAHWEKACTLALKYSLDVSPVEESLMEMLHPEGNIDAQWVENVSALIREMIGQLSAEAGAGATRRAAASDRVRAAAERLGAPLAERARLSVDLRPPLDVLKHSLEGNNLASEVLAYEREVCEAGAAAAAAGGAGDAAGVRQALRALQRLNELLPKLQHALHDVENKWWGESGGRRLTRQAAVAAPSRGGGGGGGGERNAQGAGVWKRVRLKLEGRDPDPARRCAPHEQVEYIINEATSAENLSQMYEGWMAWV